MHVPCNLPLRLSWAEGGVKESGASCALSCRCADAHSVMVLLSACSLEGRQRSYLWAGPCKEMYTATSCTVHTRSWVPVSILYTLQ